MHKLGYLRAILCDDVLYIETFLFLTMNGTPEGDLLWKKRRLAKRDKQETGLDNIRTFLMTDLQFDQGLVDILKDCGCGHLFDVLKNPLGVNQVEIGYAHDIRKYLMIDNAEK